MVKYVELVTADTPLELQKKINDLNNDDGPFEREILSFQLFQLPDGTYGAFVLVCRTRNY